MEDRGRKESWAPGIPLTPRSLAGIPQEPWGPKVTEPPPSPDYWYRERELLISKDVFSPWNLDTFPGELLQEKGSANRFPCR